MSDIIGGYPPCSKPSAHFSGAIAFSRAGEPRTGEFEPADVLKRFGEVPAEDALMGYD